MLVHLYHVEVESEYPPEKCQEGNDYFGPLVQLVRIHEVVYQD